MSAVEIELTNGSKLIGSVLARALNLIVVHTNTGKFMLISKFALKDPKKFKMKD